jgi:hypothetical protein
MRTKRLISGLDNNQKIRVICNGVGFYTTVKGAFDLCFTEQRGAVTSALVSLGCKQNNIVGERSTGYASRYTVYNNMDQQVEVDVQVDLC